MIFYIVNIFLSAFLLFQIQPMIARYILPWFGGTPMVWSTVQLFFQVFLTGGYAYAYWLIGRIPEKRQGWIHVAFLTISLAVIAALGFAWPSPITPDASWKPVNVDTPVSDIFRLLLVGVGLPYFLLAANSPLMQSWFHRTLPGRSPYWLYALSNIGSLLGLLAYPFLVEPNLTLKAQGWAWSGGYILFALLTGYGALKSSQVRVEVVEKPGLPVSAQAAGKISIQLQVLWIVLSAIASLLLLAVTNQMTQEVASIPFLWVLPLSIYLLTFVLTYSDERWYNRRLFGGLLVLASVGFGWAMLDTHANFIALIGVYSFILFVSAMICNGEAYRLRPDPAHLTRFYLMTSIGGALGGVMVNLVAPFIFRGYWELPIGFGLTWVVMLAIFVTRKSSVAALRIRFIHNVLVGAAVLAFGLTSAYSLLNHSVSGANFEGRNFYGVVRVRTVYADDPVWRGYALTHGITMHGLQFIAPDKRDLPTTYYVEQSGVGLAILNHPRHGLGMRVGGLGLGIGTLAAYGQAGDSYRFYEINPLVISLAEGQGGFFSYLADSKAQVTPVLGDARISLERESPNNFDILVLDTFNSDSIPVHLVTKEAFAIYLRHLAPDGILAAHISNRYLDLRPVFWTLSQYYHLQMILIGTPQDEHRTSASEWVLMTRNPALFQIPAIAQRATRLDDYRANVSLWTDDFSNLFQILR